MGNAPRFGEPSSTDGSRYHTARSFYHASGGVKGNSGQTHVRARRRGGFPRCDGYRIGGRRPCVGGLSLARAPSARGTGYASWSSLSPWLSPATRPWVSDEGERPASSPEASPRL